MNTKNSIILQWVIDKSKKDPSSTAYTALLLMASTLSTAYFIYTKEYMSAVAFFVMAIFIIWYIFAKQPNETVAITAEGILYNGKSYAFKDIAEYWIPKNQKNIYFKTIGRLSRDFSIPLGNQEVEQIINTFPDNILYVEREEGVLDRFNSLLN